MHTASKLSMASAKNMLAPNHLILTSDVAVLILHMSLPLHTITNRAVQEKLLQLIQSLFKLQANLVIASCIKAIICYYKLTPTWKWRKIWREHFGGQSCSICS